MSVVAESWPEPKSTGFPRKYPWELWTDGQIHICTRGVDFHTHPRKFASAAWMFGLRHGLQTMTRVRGKHVFIRFTDPMKVR